MRERILIIGGTGFLGQNLINKYLIHDYNIISISKKKNLPKNKTNLIYKSLNISKKKDLKKIKDCKFNYVINFGGNIDHKNRIETHKAHFLGVKNIVETINFKNLRLFIQIGSSLEYGDVSSPQNEKSKCLPSSTYGKAKFLASKYLVAKFKNLKKKFLILRPYQIYGPHQKLDRLIPQVIKNCLDDKCFDCTEGSQLRDFLYIDDFINLLKKILKKKKIDSGIYNVGYGKPIKVKDVVNKINLIIGTGKPNFGKIKMRKDEINSLYPNINKLKKNFKWTPKTNFNLGIKKTIKFYKNT